ncbi:hypothetical protein IST455A_05105 [Burkholderia multivorans]|nr:hypothetical protein AI46_17180 [Burkholderia multivorans R-20526]CAB5285237.1 hypothetical protein IST495B_04973 [Burkholderia multivorans]CAB5300179.1 hypothetical protein IST4119_04804 [Burkholderia multivorans]CAB5300908.1 hypothetical protein IST461_02174 [Burkholderia multivorans]CAB5309868.1 hypothetical protein IST455B_05260 [Burkholderia multivorans]
MTGIGIEAPVPVRIDRPFAGAGDSVERARLLRGERERDRLRQDQRVVAALQQRGHHHEIGQRHAHARHQTVPVEQLHRLRMRGDGDEAQRVGCIAVEHEIVGQRDAPRGATRHQQYAAFVQQRGALEMARRVGEVTEREIDAARFERDVQLAFIDVQRLDHRARRAALEFGEQRRQEGARREVAHVKPEHALRRVGRETAPFVEHVLQDRERLIDRYGEPLGARRRFDTGAGAHEQRVAEHQPQPAERMAHGRLRDAELQRRAADVPLRVDGAKRLQQIQIEVLHAQSVARVGIGRRRAAGNGRRHRGCLAVTEGGWP